MQSADTEIMVFVTIHNSVESPGVVFLLIM